MSTSERSGRSKRGWKSAGRSMHVRCGPLRSPAQSCTPGGGGQGGGGKARVRARVHTSCGDGVCVCVRFVFRLGLMFFTLEQQRTEATYSDFSTRKILKTWACAIQAGISYCR
eukprot:5540236-Pyramimonas_sp.AAC.2